MKEEITALAQRTDSAVATVDVAQTRAAQEVQAAMVVAKKFPRDTIAAERRILDACKRPALAKAAAYEYQRGGGTITGPSIRLAEVAAQAYGNLDFGIIELEQRNGESSVMAYAWDLETNTRSTKVFTVRHERRSGRGDENAVIKRLSDPRDIYEMVANNGARRLRACILAVIPGDIIESALDECEKTMAGQNSKPLADRIKEMLTLFAPYRVSQDMIEERIGHKLSTITERELMALGRVFTGIRDGFSDVAESFSQPQPASGTSRADVLKQKLAPPPAAPQPPPQEHPDDLDMGDKPAPAPAPVAPQPAAPVDDGKCKACGGMGVDTKGMVCAACHGGGQAPQAPGKPPSAAQRKANAAKAAAAIKHGAVSIQGSAPRITAPDQTQATAGKTPIAPAVAASVSDDAADFKRKVELIDELEPLESKGGKQFREACGVAGITDTLRWRMATTEQLTDVMKILTPQE